MIEYIIEILAYLIVLVNKRVRCIYIYISYSGYKKSALYYVNDYDIMYYVPV